MNSFTPKHTLIRQDIPYGDRYGHHAPTTAEKWPYNTFEIFSKKPSAFLPNRTIQHLEGMRCPGCNDHMPAMSHGCYAKCGECGLEMELFGNSLEVWR